MNGRRSLASEREAQRVLLRVRMAWEQAVHSMQQMYQASVVKPADLFAIFRVDPDSGDDEVKLLVGPIVFNVPERPNRAKADLYIVVEGWLTFEGPDFKGTPLRTKNFGTQVGYFRSRAGALEHVYGAHYDMDEARFGHPVFHAQIGPQLAFGGNVHDQFSVAGEILPGMGNTLKTVRTPSAQMDVFAVMTQICADHLIWKDSSVEVMGAFTGLRASCDFLIGAAHRLAYLNAAQAAHCYRSTHWYDAPAAQCG